MNQASRIKVKNKEIVGRTINRLIDHLPVVTFLKTRCVAIAAKWNMRAPPAAGPDAAYLKRPRSGHARF